MNDSKENIVYFCFHCQGSINKSKVKDLSEPCPNCNVSKLRVITKKEYKDFLRWDEEAMRFFEKAIENGELPDYSEELEVQ